MFSNQRKKEKIIPEMILEKIMGVGIFVYNL